MNDSPGTLTLVQQLPNDDVYRTGPTPDNTLYVIPGLWSGMPNDVLQLLRARRKASVTGTCPICGATAEVGEQRRTMAHEDFCGTADDYLGPKLATWAREVGTYARGRRLAEDPAS